MQTFLPYPDLRASSVVLDDRRLGKQRVETLQILRALTWTDYAWRNHPAVRMWRGFVPALVRYGRENCREWTRRGHADAVAAQLLEWSDGIEPAEPELPPWFGWEPVHRSHRSALLRKDPEWYGPIFGSATPDDLPYVWPPDVFPTWPVRSGGDALDLGTALHRLNLTAPRPGQAEAARAVAAGRDVLLVMRPGAGGSTAGLIAGLMTPDRTLWLHPAPMPRAAPAPEVRGPVAGAPGAVSESPSIARPPAPADVLAMKAEAAPPEFVFRTPGEPVAGRFGLVVADGVAVPQASGAPRLVITPRADAGERADLLAQLHDPVHVGGGWDPGGVLDAVRVDSVAAGSRVLVDAVRHHGPALVVCPTRDRADRRATRIVDAGLRAKVWAPPPMRAARAASAIAAWRGRTLDALVVPEGALPPLGRVHPALLVGDDTESPAAWRDLVAEVGAPWSLLLAGPGTTEELRAHGMSTTCLRADLLDPFGEPVVLPCAGCSRCVGSGAVSYV